MEDGTHTSSKVAKAGTHTLSKVAKVGTHTSGFQGYVGAHANLDWGKIWPFDPSIGALPPCKISWQSEVHVATGGDFIF